MDMEHLILLVRERPEIYDARKAKHRDRYFIKNLWIEIATELGTDATLAKMKWQTLRSNFMREKRKLKCMASGTLNTKSTWPHMELMSFLDESVMARETSSNAFFGHSFIEHEEQMCVGIIKEEASGDYEPPSEAMVSLMRQRNSQDEEDLNNISNRTEDDNDPDMMFLRSLLPSVKQLSPLQNLAFKGEVINLLKRKLSENQRYSFILST